MLLLVLLAVVALMLHHGSCWGNLGHRTTALLAERYLNGDGMAYVQSLIGHEDISDASIWADIYKNTNNGKFTASWHFVDAQDHPPNSCNVCVSRDCLPSRVCILTAIGNMTRILQDENLRWQERHEALKFLIHLIGDLHCPLHVESAARGGNDIAVIFEGQTMSLHFLWDVIIPQKLTGSNESNEKVAAELWAERLFQRAQWPKLDEHIFSGYARRQSKQRDSELTDIDTLALAWARESNQLVCKYVAKDGFPALQGSELSGSYYEDALPVVEDLLGKAGRRLGTWINLLAAREKSAKIDILQQEL